jgi:hypothetical protein
MRVADNTGTCLCGALYIIYAESNAISRRAFLLSITASSIAIRSILRLKSEVLSAIRPHGNRSILPEPIEAVGAQLGISHRVHDVAVAEEVLKCPSINPIIG